MTTQTVFTDEQLTIVHDAARELFGDAVAQGVHSPFGLDCEYWGREYAGRLLCEIGEMTSSPTDSKGLPE